jgi:glycosyltransferase involved in cell wall biosynthesis
MRNLLFVSSITFPHGMADTSRVKELCTGFAENNLNVDLIVHRQNKQNFPEYNFRVFSIEYSDLEVKKRSIFSLIASRFIFFVLFIRLNLRNSYDVVYFYNPNFDNFISAFFLKIFSNSKIIVEYTDIITAPKSFSLVFYLQRFSFIYFPYLCNDIVVISLRLKRYFEIFYKVTPFLIRALSPTRDINFSKHENNSIIAFDSTPKSNINFAFAGSLIESEGVDDLLEVFMQLCLLNKNIFLNIAGFSLVRNSNEIRKKILDFNLDSCVKFHGFLNSDDVSRLLANSNILVLPKRNTKYNRFGFSTKLPEYLTYGKIVVCSDISDFRNLLGMYEGIIFYNPDQKNALYNALSYAIKNFEYLDSNCKKDKYEIVNLFSTKMLTKSFCEKYI